MSMRYKGGVISATPPTASTTSAPGIWTLQQQFQNAGNWPFGGPFTYIEDVFSTYLYTGNGTSQTINNGIDLAGKGGLVWIKQRTTSTPESNHELFDTARGINLPLQSNFTGGNLSLPESLTSFNANGFSLSFFNGAGNRGNASGATYVSWTFRKQPKFFDVVTYTGNATARTIAHNLGSVPGCVIVKRTDATSNWQVYHRGLISAAYSIQLNSTATQGAATTVWNSTAPTSTQFSVGTDASVNANGGTYVAYLFAHNAGGFGTSGTDNVISCGSYDGNSVNGVGGTAVNLGWEPQFLLVKCAYPTPDAYTDWFMFDNMRGCGAQGALSSYLAADTSGAEGAESIVNFTATGFQLNYSYSSSNNAFNRSGCTYIYIAIRRGPMKTPTTGTSVFSPQTATGVQTTGFPVDMQLGVFDKSAPASYDPNTRSRLINIPYLVTSSTAAETGSTNVGFDSNTGLTYSWPSGNVNWYFRRAPGFFDVVCYTGTGGLGTVTHNLGAVPELMIVKSRSNALDWIVYSQPTGNNRILKLNSSGTGFSTDYWQDTTPTATSVFLSGVPDNEVYGNGITYVMYLFASCPGVSKVGSYTGTGTTLQVNCGFTGGARFVLIKRTDDSGDWYVWDSARGIVSGNDPYLLLNSTAAEVTNTDYVDTYSAGFEISSTAPAAINANGGTFIFLAIA